MTTSVTVKTRGLGATVEVDGQSHRIEPNQDRRFDTDSTTTVKITQDEQEAAPVPGSEQNDELVKEVPLAELDRLSGKTNSNKTGATETAQSTDQK